MSFLIIAYLNMGGVLRLGLKWTGAPVAHFPDSVVEDSAEDIAAERGRVDLAVDIEPVAMRGVDTRV